MNLLRVIDRGGPEEFSHSLAFQQNLVSDKAQDETLPEMLVFVEHKEIFTLGRGSKIQTPTTRLKKEVEWREISRGGDATFHGPGQLVAYPIFNLKRYGSDVHVFLRKLELVIEEALSKFDIEAQTRPGLTGVWTNSSSDWKKIASIGIGVRKWISYHGLALNVTTDLSYFRAISPCGLDSNVMTSMEVCSNANNNDTPTMESVKTALTEAFVDAFDLTLESKQNKENPKRPSWLKVQAPGSAQFIGTNNVVKNHGLVTVCEEAHCPNIGECWSHQTATFMIMGDSCTRRCGFCSVKDGALSSLAPLDPLEPYRVSKAIAKLGLKHVVVTSVNRDDLEDMGALHFHTTARCITREVPECAIEFLIPDMRGDRELLEIIMQDGFVNVLNHNIETVPSLYKRVRPGAKFSRSLDILKWAHEIDSNLQTKTGIMLGLGENRKEVLNVMDALREVNCNILTIGQYLQPTKKQLPIAQFVTPAEFADYKEEGLARGFSHVESGPFVRSSYHAWKHTKRSSDSNLSPQLIAKQ